jgi:hypothetical protein
MNAKELQGIEFLFHGIQVLATDGSGPGRAVRGSFLLLETIRYLPETQVETRDPPASSKRANY